MSRVIRVDSEIFALIRDNKKPGETASDTVKRLLREVGVDFFDYAGHTTDQLLAKIVEIKSDIETGEACDNNAEGTCCDFCNRWEIIDELARRRVRVSL